uniref:Muellerian-inhibiting factor n=1 Tax=Pelusios castaneus TaxID=367368 RepID=A0A8C8SAX7_9SAUR
MAQKSKATAGIHLVLKHSNPGGDSNGAKCQQLNSEEVEVSPDLGLDSSLHPWPIGGLEGPVCTVKMGRRNSLGQSHLEVVGVLTSYESNFLKEVRHSSWDEGQLETFGICPSGVGHAALLSLKHLHAHLAEPGENRFLVLHLEEGTCLPETCLAYPCSSPLSHPLSERPPASLLSLQALCLSRDTRYLLLGASVAPLWEGGILLLFIPFLHPLHVPPGSLLPPEEAQQLLFGTDEKRFTRMTPALLLLVTPRCEEALVPSSFLPAGGVVETAPYPQPRCDPALNASSPAPGRPGQFLGSLTWFVSRVLSPSGESPTASEPHHRLDVKTMETLPHQPLNLSEGATLEQLVQSEEPLVLLFPPNSQALLERQFGHWRLEGSLLQLLLEKLQAVIQELREIPAFQANVGLFQHLLAFCYYPPGPGSSDVTGLPPGPRKLRTLLLLKALQTVRAHWQEERKVSRQNRSARPQAYCRLQELMVDLYYENFLIIPKRYAANNCEGPCKLPLSTRISNHSTHTVLLLGMQERGAPLQRSPCCVPVKYSSKDFILVTTEGFKVASFPDLVAEECGCR